MAQCKMCGRKGFFLSVSENGICKRCEQVNGILVQQHRETIKYQMKRLAESRIMKERLSCCDEIIEHAQMLLELEQEGVPTGSPSPSQLLEEYTDMHNQIVAEKIVKIGAKVSELLG